MAGATPIEQAGQGPGGVASNWTVGKIALIILVSLSVVIEAFDNQLLGLAVPTIGAEFGIDKTMFAQVFAVGLVGIGLGAVGAGALGDRIGLRATFMSCVLLFALPSLATSLAHNIGTLMALRFFGGLGIGGLTPIAATLAAELSPPRWRSAVVMFIIACVPLGGMVAGTVSGLVLDAYGWRTLFVAGGTAPLLLLLFLFFALPRSSKGSERASQAAAVGDGDDDDGKGDLLTILRRRDTIALFAAFFFSLLNAYSFQSWLPSVLSTMGLDVMQRGTASATFNFGGLAGIIIGSAMLTRFGSRPVMLLLCAVAGLDALALSQGMTILTWSPVLLYGLLAVQAAALGLIQAALYSLAIHVYPVQVRTTALGVSVGLGRVGAVLSSFTGAQALKMGGSVAFFGGVAIVAVIVLLCLASIRRHIPPAKDLA